jgi:hypothetical protein
MEQLAASPIVDRIYPHPPLVGVRWEVRPGRLSKVHVAVSGAAPHVLCGAMAGLYEMFGGSSLPPPQLWCKLCVHLREAARRDRVLDSLMRRYPPPELSMAHLGYLEEAAPPVVSSSFRGGSF